MNESSPTSAFVSLSESRYFATVLTRGPWDLKHQHAGPPIALVLGAIERVIDGENGVVRSEGTAIPPLRFSDRLPQWAASTRPA